ncbi:MAG: TlpA family protein disulfide reductase, partial [Opitutaceae bacterium]|nr:TlpA family protein disulfide reductase [Opitutaceae bacterium]
APCRKEIPEYIALQEKYRERGLVILGFSLDEDGPAGVKQFGQMMKVNYPLIMADGDTSIRFGEFEYIPTAFVIDRAGNIRHMKSGPADMAAFEALIKSLL